MGGGEVGGEWEVVTCRRGEGTHGRRGMEREGEARHE